MVICRAARAAHCLCCPKQTPHPTPPQTRWRVPAVKVNRAPTLGASGRQGSVGGQGSDAGCPLRFLAGLADDVATPLGQQGPSGSGAGGTAPGQQQQQQQAAASGTGARAAPRLPEPVALLSKKLLRVSEAAGWAELSWAGLGRCQRACRWIGLGQAWLLAAGSLDAASYGDGVCLPAGLFFVSSLAKSPPSPSCRVRMAR